MDLDRIAKRYPRAKVDKCAEKGCNLRAISESEFLILKGEIVDPRNRMCDCMVFGEDGKIVLVELKGTVQHVRRIFEKFKNSKTASLDIASEAGSEVSRIIPVLLAKRYRRPFEYATIEYENRKRKCQIKIGKCGDRISKFTGAQDRHRARGQAA